LRNESGPNLKLLGCFWWATYEKEAVKGRER
jgi:hypothetical protein